MKPLTTTSVDLLKTPLALKITAFTLISITFFYLGKHWSDDRYQQLIFFSSSSSTPTEAVSLSPNYNKSFIITSLITQNHTDPSLIPTPPPQIPLSPSPPPPSSGSNQTFGIIDADGKMSDDFEVGEFDPEAVENWGNGSVIDGGSEGVRGVKVRRFELCPGNMTDYVPCMDNVEAIMRLNSTERGERFDRHCPEKGKGLNCLVPPPKGYRQPIPWPRSRDEV